MDHSKAIGATPSLHPGRVVTLLVQLHPLMIEFMSSIAENSFQAASVLLRKCPFARERGNCPAN